MHYIFDGIKCAKVYINKVFMRGKIAEVEALYKTEKKKKQSTALKLKKIKIHFVCNRNNISRRKMNTAK